MIIQGGVGFFDSGLGGLNILRECLSCLLGLPAYYYGDNEFAPYGNKRKEELAPRVFQAFEVFSALKVSAAVIACNTVTSLFLEELQEKYPFPIVGTFPFPNIPVEEGTAVLVTRGTAESPRVRALVKKMKNIRLVGCEELAGEIERHLGERGYDFTSFLPKITPKLVYLGCTHYPFIREQIEKFYACRAVDNHGEVAKSLEKILKNTPKNEENPLGFLWRKRQGGFLRKFPPKNTLKKCRKKRFFRSLQPLYFLGSGRFKNSKFYKRMFVFTPKGEKVVKNSQNFSIF